MAYPPVFSLRTVSIDGNNDAPLPSEGSGYASYVHPDISRDAKLVAGRIAMESDIYRYQLDGTPLENANNAWRITYQTGQVQVPSASPGGERVAYISDSGGHANIWVARIDGTEPPRQITFEQDPDTVIGLPVWSPRGDRIVYYRAAVGAGSPEEWLVTPEGTGHDLLVRARGGEALPFGCTIIYVSGQIHADSLECLKSFRTMGCALTVAYAGRAEPPDTAEIALVDLRTVPGLLAPDDAGGG